MIRLGIFQLLAVCYLVLLVSIVGFYQLAYGLCKTCPFQFTNEGDCGKNIGMTLDCCYECKRHNRWAVAGPDCIKYDGVVSKLACIESPTGGTVPIEVTNRVLTPYPQCDVDCPDSDDDCETTAAMVGAAGTPFPVSETTKCFGAP